MMEGALEQEGISLQLYFEKAIISLCKQNFFPCNTIELDAIICISVVDSKDHVVKIHKTLMSTDTSCPARPKNSLASNNLNKQGSCLKQMTASKNNQSSLPARESENIEKNHDFNQTLHKFSRKNLANKNYLQQRKDHLKIPVCEPSSTLGNHKMIRNEIERSELPRKRSIVISRERTSEEIGDDNQVPSKDNLFEDEEIAGNNRGNSGTKEELFPVVLSAEQSTVIVSLPKGLENAEECTKSQTFSSDYSELDETGIGRPCDRAVKKEDVPMSETTSSQMLPETISSQKLPGTSWDDPEQHGDKGKVIGKDRVGVEEEFVVIKTEIEDSDIDFAVQMAVRNVENLQSVDGCSLPVVGVDTNKSLSFLKSDPYITKEKCSQEVHNTNIGAGSDPIRNSCYESVSFSGSCPTENIVQFGGDDNDSLNGTPEELTNSMMGYSFNQCMPVTTCDNGNGSMFMTPQCGYSGWTSKPDKGNISQGKINLVEEPSKRQSYVQSPDMVSLSPKRHRSVPVEQIPNEMVEGFCSRNSFTYSPLMAKMSCYRSIVTMPSPQKCKNKQKGHVPIDTVEKQSTPFIQNASLPDGKKHRCRKCGAMFSCVRSRSRHERFTCGSIRFECHVCLKWFSRSDARCRHMRLMHGLNSSVYERAAERRRQMYSLNSLYTGVTGD